MNRKYCPRTGFLKAFLRERLRGRILSNKTLKICQKINCESSYLFIFAKVRKLLILLCPPQRLAFLLLDVIAFTKQSLESIETKKFKV